MAMRMAPEPNVKEEMIHRPDGGSSRSDTALTIEGESSESTASERKASAAADHASGPVLDSSQDDSAQQDHDSNRKDDTGPTGSLFARSNIDIANTRAVFPPGALTLNGDRHASLPGMALGFETAGTLSEAPPLPTPLTPTNILGSPSHPGSPSIFGASDAIESSSSRPPLSRILSSFTASPQPSRMVDTPPSRYSLQPSRPPAKPPPPARPKIHFASPSSSVIPQSPPTAVAAAPSTVQKPTPQERLEWQSMLTSVLTGEVIRSEKDRFNPQAPTHRPPPVPPPPAEPLFPFLPPPVPPAVANSLEAHSMLPPQAKRNYHADQRTAIWFGVRAKVRDRTETEERWWVEQARRSVVPGAVKNVLEFEVKDEEDDGGGRSPYQQVVDVLTLVDLAESLFPTRRHLIAYYPDFASLQFTYNVDALVSWLAVTRSLKTQVHVLRSWTNSETILSADRVFIERILKESGVKGTFEKRIMTILSGLVRRAKDAMVSNAQAFSKMKLPVNMDDLSQLAAFPGSLMEEILRVRLEYAEVLMRPRDGSSAIGEVIEDFGITLGFTARIKRETLFINAPAPGWHITSSLSSTYDTTFLSSLRFYFRLLGNRLKLSTEGAFFKEVEALEGEYDFITGVVAPWCKGADVEAAEEFCALEEQLLMKVKSYFQANMNVGPSFLTTAPNTGSGALGARGKFRRTEVAIPENAEASRYGSEPRVDGPEDSFDERQRTVATDRSLTLGGASHTPPPSLSLSIRSVAVEATLAAASGAIPPTAALARWYRSRVLENVRSRSRKLLQFLRRLIEELECAAEYDLNDVESLVTRLNRSGHSLLDCDGTGKYVTETGSLVFASPALRDKPEVVKKMLKGCFVRDRQGSSVGTGLEVADGGGVCGVGPSGWLTVVSPGKGKVHWGRKGVLMQFSEPPMLNSRPFLVRTNRARLVTDGGDILMAARANFEELIEMAANNNTNESTTISSASFGAARNMNTQRFPITVGSAIGSWGVLRKEHKAHQRSVGFALKSVKRTLMSLAILVVQSIETARDMLRKAASLEAARARFTGIAESSLKLDEDGATAGHRESDELNDGRPASASGSAGSSRSGTLSIGSEMGPGQELLEEWFTFASDFGYRVLRYIGKKGRKELNHKLVRLSVDWMHFVVRDCVNTDKRTFRWALLALEFAMKITSENISELRDDEFVAMRIGVARCMSLSVSHVDILGARQLAREALEASSNRHEEFSRPALGSIAETHKWLSTDVMTAEREHWIRQLSDLEEDRQRKQRGLRVIGKVLDSQNIEDRNISFLASSVGSSITFRWQQGKFLGGGSFGSVYMGINLDSGDVMAVKEIKFQDVSSLDSLKRNIKEEMNVMQMLHHTNIVDYYGVEVHKDKLYIFMEYCPTSMARLLEHGRMDDEAIVRVYAKQMLKGLQYLHSKDIVHRDVKPANTLMDAHGTLKFVDFGASKIYKNQKTIVVDGEQNSFIGTPHYMAPEVITGEPFKDIPKGAQDIWSMGCCVLEMITGRKPWNTLDNEWAIMYHIGISGRHPPLPDPTQISDEGMSFLALCFTRPAKDRPTATQLLEHPWVCDVDENAFYITEGLTPSPGFEVIAQPFGLGQGGTLAVSTLSSTPGTGGYSNPSTIATARNSPVSEVVGVDYISAFSHS
ncbi:hypothetical protein M427DRAFT_121535 [Gonapodya prolifera JEL478]|uniref:Protein kinase domain-containing protein n=1 Tax=Gonapodya prolifera (strain JEL478) TaxID=1344416 RepID=A0A139AM63_GONPJ|nr:hypothetical protein M427DRAFT_121535 [Gonapodya prolifera JEL478]|eukprot:KXS17866.1 hypothetical protein M427DRAFT_121535 [Gonapodya prolifera JEL478]